MTPVELFGIQLHNVTQSEALQAIQAFLAGGGKHVVTTPNVDHIVRLHRDAEFAAAYQRASLVVADGMPIVWASRLLGRPLKERVAGSDLFPRLCEQAARSGRTVFLLGGLPGAAAQAAKRLSARFPSLRVVGAYGPPVGFEANPAENWRAIHLVNGARPDLLFVGLGSPKQEKWIAQHLPALEVKVALCVGASIDFEAGLAKRAPRWMQVSGLEWLWRLLREPARLWRRYLVHDMAFLGIFLSEWWRLRAERAEAVR